MIKPELLIEAAGDVEVLHGLSRRPLDEVVDGGKDDDGTRPLVQPISQKFEPRTAFVAG